MKDFIDLQGASGASYRFRLWPEGAAHQPIAGNFALVKTDGDNCTVVSVGESLDLSRLRLDLAKNTLKAGMEVYTRLNVARAARDAEHADLASRYKTAAVRERSGQA